MATKLKELPAHLLRSTRDPFTLYPNGKISLRHYDSNFSLVVSTPVRLLPYMDGKGKRQYRFSLNTNDPEVAVVRAQGHLLELHRRFAKADLARVVATMEALT